jgi:hypothetical protein
MLGGSRSARLKRGLTLAALVSAGQLAGLSFATGAASANQVSTCPIGSASVINLAYVIFAADGSSQNVTTLKEHVAPGDQVNVLFDVPSLPSGCSAVQLSIAAYTRTSSHRHAEVFSSDTGSFIAGGRYEMTTMTAPRSTSGLVRVIVVFASGPVRPRPHYGNNRIDHGRG